MIRRILIGAVEYLLGFLALAVFAYLAFGTGPQTDARFINAFKISAVVAVVELAILFSRTVPANRLIIGANLWLVLGGVAAFLEQWSFLRIYQHFGEASLFSSILAVGIVSLVISPAGFIGQLGERRTVLYRSLILLLAVLVAIAVAMHYRGNVKYAAVFPVIALSWLNRLLRQRIPTKVSSVPSSQTP